MLAALACGCDARAVSGTRRVSTAGDETASPAEAAPQGEPLSEPIPLPRSYVVGQRWEERVTLAVDVYSREGGGAWRQVRHMDARGVFDVQVTAVDPQGALRELHVDVVDVGVDGEVRPASADPLAAPIVVRVAAEGLVEVPAGMDERLDAWVRLLMNPCLGICDSVVEPRPLGDEFPRTAESPASVLGGPSCAPLPGDAHGTLETARQDDGTILVTAVGSASHCPSWMPRVGATTDFAEYHWDWSARVPEDATLPPLSVRRRTEHRESLSFDSGTLGTRFFIDLTVERTPR